jgi:hypothetical protein
LNVSAAPSFFTIFPVTRSPFFNVTWSAQARQASKGKTKSGNFLLIILVILT